MNIAKLTSWHVVDKNSRTTLVAAPFCMRNGGEMISFYIHKKPDGSYIISDEGFCASYADMYGVNLTPARREMMQKKAHASFAQFNDDNTIISRISDIDDLEFALIDAMKLALAVSYEMDSWLPKTKEKNFVETLQSKIIESIPSKEVVSKLKVTGHSHNDIVIPLAVRRENSNKTYLIETINKNAHWGSIYGIQGKFSDIKLLNADEFSPFVIFESGMDEELVANARNLLTSVASTQIYTPDQNWSSVFVA